MTNVKKSTSRHSIVNIPKTKEKENIVKAVGENNSSYTRKTTIRLMPTSHQSDEARKQWDDWKCLCKTLSARNLVSGNTAFTIQCEINTSQNLKKGEREFVTRRYVFCKYNSILIRLKARDTKQQFESTSKNIIILFKM